MNPRYRRPQVTRESVYSEFDLKEEMKEQEEEEDGDRN